MFINEYLLFCIKNIKSYNEYKNKILMDRMVEKQKQWREGLDTGSMYQVLDKFE